MSTATTAAPLTWDEKIARLRNRKPAEIVVTIPDDDALDAVGQAQREALDVRQAARRRIRANVGPDVKIDAEDIDADPEVQAALERIKEAEANAKALEISFRFRQLPPDVYDQLPLQFPPTDAQSALNMAYNPDEYLPALFAACSVDPIDVETVKGLLYGLRDENGDPVLAADGEPVQPPVFNQGEVQQIVASLRGVNEVHRVQVGKG